MHELTQLHQQSAAELLRHEVRLLIRMQVKLTLHGVFLQCRKRKPEKTVKESDRDNCTSKCQIIKHLIKFLFNAYHCLLGMKGQL